MVTLYQQQSEIELAQYCREQLQVQKLGHKLAEFQDVRNIGGHTLRDHKV
jgi:ribosomal protein S19